MSRIFSKLINDIDVITGRNHHLVVATGIDGVDREYAVWPSMQGDWDSDDEQLPYVCMVDTATNNLEMSQFWIRQAVVGN